MMMIIPTFTFNGSGGVESLVVLVLCFLFDGVAPHVDQAGAGGAPWYRRHSSSSLRCLRSPVHTQATNVGWQSVSSDPVLHCHCLTLIWVGSGKSFDF